MSDLKEKNKSSIQGMQDTANDVTRNLEKAQAELKILTDKLSFERDKTLLEADKNHQAQIASANENYNEKICELYKNIEETRQTFDNKVNNLEKSREEVASKYSKELSDQKVYFEKEIAILKKQLRS